MKSRATFLLTLFAVLLLLPAELLACACCAERGHYRLSYSSPDEYAMNIIKQLNFSNPELYMTAAGEEGVEGLKAIAESYKANGMLTNNSWKFNFTDSENRTGTLNLPLPDKMVQYEVDIHDGGDSGAGSPNLYKEWRFKAVVKDKTGIFQNPNKVEYFLVLQGRGNACTMAEDFKNWRLEITGKNTEYAFFGDLSTESEMASKYMIDSDSVGAIKLGMTVAEAKKVMPEANFTRSSDGEGIALIGVLQNKDVLMTLYAGEEDSEAAIDENAKIEFIEVWSSEYKTAEGVHPNMKLSDAEKKYGKVKEIQMSEIESREYAKFANHPKGFDFRLSAKNSMAGMYKEGKMKTSKYSPNTYIFSIQISK